MRHRLFVDRPVSTLATLGLGLGLVACGGGGGGDDDPPFEGSVGANDVSILLPRPASDAELDALLALSAAGVGGPLLDEARFDTITVFSDNPSEERAYDRWRIIGVRIDPCFPSLDLLETNPAACRRQLRLIAQPLNPVVGLPPEAHDAAIHLFYDQTEADFRALAADLVALQTEATASHDLALGQHPTITAEGLGGATHAALKDLIATYAGEGRLSQMTFMEGRGVAWEFGGVMIDGADQTDIVIHGIAAEDGDTRQTNGSDVNGIFGITPATAESEILEALAGVVVGDPKAGGSTVELDAPAADIEAALQLSLDIDNPATAFNPDTVDCVSCHVAGRARARAATLGYPSDGLERYESARNLTLTDEPAALNTPMAMRMFGHNGQAVVIGQRVVNESAAVADAIEALLAE
jgi:hypothetical protein